MDWLFYTRSQLADLEPTRLRDVHINIFYHRCFPEFQRHCINKAEADEELRQIVDGAANKARKTDDDYMLLMVLRFQSFIKCKEETEGVEHKRACAHKRKCVPESQHGDCVVSIKDAEQRTASTRKVRRLPKTVRAKYVGSPMAKGAPSQETTTLSHVPAALTLPLRIDESGYMLLRHNAFCVTRRRGENCVLDAVAQALGDADVVNVAKLRTFASSHDCDGCDARSLSFIARFLNDAKTPYRLVRDPATQSSANLFRASPAIRLVSYEMPLRNFHCVVFDTFRRLLVDNDEDRSLRYHHWDETMASDDAKALALLSRRYAFVRIREAYLVKVHAKRLDETCHDKHCRQKRF